MRGVMILFISIWLVACAGTGVKIPNIIVDDLPNHAVIRLINRENSPAQVYYNYVEEFGNLQMLQMRFRDRNGVIVPITDAPGGWFTPHMRYASIRWPPRRRLIVPARSSVDLDRSIVATLIWASWDRPVEGPCEVQLKLFSYLGPRTSRHVEFLSNWGPGPCPA